jgi:hypothetical protein
LDEGLIFEIVFNDARIKDEIIRLNTEEQLFRRGIDSEGKSLGTYSPFTVEIKKKKGQPTNRITLKDTGEFYDSFRVTANRVSITIDADPIKDDNNLFDDFGEEILGLTDESREKLKEMAVKKYLEYWKTNILR